MGADLIGLGWTSNGSDPAPLTGEEALALLFKHRTIILADTALQEFFMDDETPDGELLKKIADGMEDLRKGGPYRETTSYEIIGTSFMFNFAGGMSWGDEPFDEFAGMSAAIYFSEKIPEIGDRIGVLGSGVLPFGRPELTS